MKKKPAAKLTVPALIICTRAMCGSLASSKRPVACITLASGGQETKWEIPANNLLGGNYAHISTINQYQTMHEN
jgi:hypothetical protein